VLAALLACGSPILARADFRYRAVADTETRVPGGRGQFTGFFPPPSIDEGRVAFQASASGEGIYRAAGGEISVVADVETPVPSGDGLFSSFGLLSPSSGAPALSRGEVAFYAQGAGQAGIYRTRRGRILRVADLNTRIPAGKGFFTGFGSRPDFDEGQVVFVGFGSGGQAGIYVATGRRLRRVADQSTPVPGGTGTFRSFDFDAPVISDGIVAFQSFGRIFRWNGRRLVKLIDRDTPLPGAPSGAHAFGEIAIWKGDVVFSAVDLGWQGIYRVADGRISVVVDRSTPVPGGSGSFTRAFVGSVEGEDVVFEGGSSPGGGSGVYLASGGSVTRIADTRMSVPGSARRFTVFGLRPSVSGGIVAFSAYGQGDSAVGIYVGSGGAISTIADSRVRVPDGQDFFGSLFEPGIEDGVVVFQQHFPLRC
jgi:hypothetical protein